MDDERNVPLESYACVSDMHATYRPIYRPARLGGVLVCLLFGSAFGGSLEG